VAVMSYLQRHPKTGVYWFRRAVPPKLRGVIGKREWKESRERTTWGFTAR
jgi:hypothetical protein